MTRIAALLTCHNRKNKTLACLMALMRNKLPNGVVVAVYMTDDGSTDGTTAAVRELVPHAKILDADGSAFWNGGMRIAFREAMSSDPDFHLWLNDDTELEPSAVRDLLETHRILMEKTGTDRHIVVGSARDKASQNLTYGGLNRRNGFFRPVTFSLVQPLEVERECDTMNGNCVLVPRSVANLVGNLDPGYVHSMGDTDYGLRARQVDCRVWIAPGFAGWCSRNAVAGTFVDGASPLAIRLKRVMGPKGMPPRAWWLYVRRHGGLLAPFLWAWPYMKTVLVGLKPSAHKKH